MEDGQKESQDDAVIGFVAVHPESGHPFCCDDDAFVVIAELDKLRSFVESSTGEPMAEGVSQTLHYADAVNDLMEGGALAFDAVAYERFVAQAVLDEFEVPPFKEIAMEVEDLDIELGILQLAEEGDEDDEDEDDEEDFDEDSDDDE